MPKCYRTTFIALIPLALAACNKHDQSGNNPSADVHLPTLSSSHSSKNELDGELAGFRLGMTQADVEGVIHKMGQTPTIAPSKLFPDELRISAQSKDPHGSLYEDAVQLSPIDHKVFSITMDDITPCYDSKLKIDQLKSAAVAKWGQPTGLDINGQDLADGWGNERGTYATYGMHFFIGANGKCLHGGMYNESRGGLFLVDSVEAKKVNAYRDAQNHLAAPKI